MKRKRATNARVETPSGEAHDTRETSLDWTPTARLINGEIYVPRGGNAVMDGTATRIETPGRMTRTEPVVQGLGQLALSIFVESAAPDPTRQIQMEEALAQRGLTPLSIGHRLIDSGVSAPLMYQHFEDVRAVRDVHSSAAAVALLGRAVAVDAGAHSGVDPDSIRRTRRIEDM
jgi:hypothetical protein